MSHQELQAFSFIWPADGDTAVATIPEAMSGTAYIATAKVSDLPVGGAYSDTICPEAGKTSTTVQIKAAASLKQNTIVAVVVVGDPLVPIGTTPTPVVAESGAVEWCDVAEFDSSLDEVKVAVQDWILNYTNNCINVNEFDGETGDTVKLLRLLMAAHFGTLALRSESSGGTAGPLTSQSIGGLSESYGNAMLSDSILDQTAHGQMYRSIISNSTARFPEIWSV